MMGDNAFSKRVSYIMTDPFRAIRIGTGGTYSRSEWPLRKATIVSWTRKDGSRWWTKEFRWVYPPIGPVPGLHAVSAGTRTLGAS